MGLPRTSEARRFYRCGLQRFEEAMVLRKAEMTTGAVYLAGYAAECMLKALILDETPRSRTAEVLGTFRGNQGHDLGWLRDRYLGTGHAHFPRPIGLALALVDDWSTDLRYNPESLKPGSADLFLRAIRDILAWVDERS